MELFEVEKNYFFSSEKWFIRLPKRIEIIQTFEEIDRFAINRLQEMRYKNDEFSKYLINNFPEEDSFPSYFFLVRSYRTLYQK